MKEWKDEEREAPLIITVFYNSTGNEDEGCVTGPIERARMPSYEAEQEITSISLGCKYLPDELVQALKPYLVDEVADFDADYEENYRHRWLRRASEKGR